MTGSACMAIDDLIVVPQSEGRARGVMRWLAVASMVLSSAVAGAQSSGGDSVWVNTRSRVYHCPTSPVYKNTRVGMLMPEDDARAAGYRAAGGVACTPDEQATIALAASPAPIGTPRERQRTTTPCEVTKIVDGDGIRCASLGSVRLIGIDAPEMNQAPFGAQSMAALASLVRVGATVELEGDRSAIDRNRRALAYVWVGDVMVNWQLVRNGYALAKRFRPDTLHATALEGAMAAAQRERRGLWAVGGFDCDPAERRRRAC